MCGIAGLINLNGDSVSPVLLQRMTDEIAHRGPDGEGQWIEGNIGLGHRRLAIIDRSTAGHQPMISRDGRWVMTYNGEIYNFRELRSELEAAGYQFRSNTDSEVVLNAVAHWGTDAIPKFNGMFGFAMWDREEKSLLLARDRYGIKPLYYASEGDRFSFGSEQKAIFSLPRFSRSLNKKALLEYFTFQNIFTDQTLTEGISILRPGTWMRFHTRGDKAIETVRYWDFHFREPDVRADRREYVEELGRLLRQAVNRQLVSDVEIGSYLSGGMDSGTITALASESFPDLKTFTIGFDLSSASGLELAFDERAKAELISAAFKTEHYEMVLKAGDMQRSLPSLTRHLEEPRVGQSYPNFYAAKLASRFVKVVLSGIGGDELFGGYPWRYFHATNKLDFESYIDSYYKYWQRLVSNSEIRSLFQPIWNDVKDVWTRDIFREVFDSHANDLVTSEDFINHSLYFEAKTFLHGLLVVEDKLSMAHGLETRVPFLDNDLVDFAMSCPVNLKLSLFSTHPRIDENRPGNKGEIFFAETGEGKVILREVMSKFLPSEVSQAAKQGFSGPDASWFRGESIDFVENELRNPKSVLFDVLDRSTVMRIVEEHISGQKNRRLAIWSLLNVNQFLRDFQG